MKIVTFAHGKDERLGVLQDGKVVDLAAAAEAAGQKADNFADAIAFLEAGDRARSAAARLVKSALKGGDARVVRPRGRVKLRAPIPRPGKVLCLAGNYAEHIREGGGTPPERANTTPHPFIKPVTTVIGPEDPIRLPGEFCTTVDYEGELAIVIGRPARNVTAANALDYVAGYACFNDISGRSLNITVQRQITPRTGFFDWLFGKWFDTFGPLGPYIALSDEVPNPDKLRLQTRVNGQVRQSASTGDMIFNVSEIVEWLSKVTELRPGDVIATGTPAGVGATTKNFLKDGDVVEVEIEGLGVLRNPIKA